MGYYVETRETTAVVPKAKVPSAIALATEFMGKVDTDGQGGSYGPSGRTERWYSWVDTKAANTALAKGTDEGLAEFFALWGFEEADVSPEGNVHLLWYNSKTGQEEQMLDALAPAIEGEIIWQGEEGEIWRQAFTDGTVIEESAILTYPSDTPKAEPVEGFTKRELNVIVATFDFIIKQANFGPDTEKITKGVRDKAIRMRGPLPS